MTRARSAPSQPDIGSTSFEVRFGMRRIRCNVLDEALEAASGMPQPSSSTLRRQSFDRFRTLIHAAAELKLKALPPEFNGMLTLSTADLRCVPPDVSMPGFGTPSHRQPSTTPNATGLQPGAVVEPVGGPADGEGD